MFSPGVAHKEQASLAGEGTGSGVTPGSCSSPTVLWLCDLEQVNLSERELPSLLIRVILIMPRKGTVGVK